MSAGYELAAFVKVVDRGGFSAAAADLGLTPSALSKLVSRLEERLGVRLLARSTRKVALTPEGDIYLAHCRDILAAIEAADAEVSASGARPQGVVRLNVGTAFAKHQLCDFIPDFCARYPDVHVDVSVTDRLVDVMTESVDVAIRTGSLSDSRLIARRIGESRRYICASPDYLRHRDTPQRPADLLQHNCLLLSNYSALARWPFHTPEGVNRMQVSGSLTCDSADLLLDYAVRGFGVVRLGDMLVGEAIRRGDLVPLLVDHHVDEPYALWAVMPPGRNRVLRVRVLVDALADAFRNSPWSVAMDEIEAKAAMHARRTDL